MAEASKSISLNSAIHSLSDTDELHGLSCPIRNRQNYRATNRNPRVQSSTIKRKRADSMKPRQHFVTVEFHHFKAFKAFTFHVRKFNVLVGPNNAGKSTILAGFRILAAAMRKANRRRPEVVRGLLGPTRGYNVELSAISIAEENIFHNYDDSEPAFIKFTLSNGNSLMLFFRERRSCQLIAAAKSGRAVDSPAAFKSQFNCPIGFVPILSPVEHDEPLYMEEAARLALFNYRAARNFRNIWHHFPEKFETFRSILMQTWPGMDIEPPEVDLSGARPILHMYCPEARIPREIFWAGFGFQVWCQMLTHLVQSDANSLFLIDEPDIYLHSELQRQLITLLRDLGPDIIIATHSTEIITESDPDEIVLIDKRHRSGKRIKQASQLPGIFTVLGSNLNPVLTQLAKTRRAVFVEGDDFQIISKFAAKLGAARVANRADFAVIPSEGFNPQRVKNLKDGMEFTLGNKIHSAVLFDRDFRSEHERVWITAECRKFCETVHILEEKEIENLVLVPTAIDRAATMKLSDRVKRTGAASDYSACAALILESFAEEKRSYVMAQWLEKARNFERTHSPRTDGATVNERALVEFENRWVDHSLRVAMIPGKEALSFVNEQLQNRYGVTVTANAIIDAMVMDEIPAGIREVVDTLARFGEPSVK
ncbi:MAG TPA: AAA family ATPase [Rhizomicrobium sp.]|jgi:energy-coupling factor transporter ATP-binding protein EcfA2